MKQFKKIYFVHQGLLSFVSKDLEILKQKHKVREANNHKNPLGNFFHNIVGVIWCDVIFCWFLSLTFAVPIVLGEILGKKIIIVAGGYDVVNLPSIEYGGMRGGFSSWVRRLLLGRAHKVIAISRSNMSEAITNAGVSPEKIKMIYHGFKPVEKKSAIEREKIVITVGVVAEKNFHRKGLLFFVEAAKSFPDIPFYMIGKLSEQAVAKIKEIAPDNLTITGYISKDELEKYFSRAKVYVQASMHEGFGCSVAEAMQYECIPVVSDCFALPEVIGDSGYTFKPGDVTDLVEKIRFALDDDSDLGKRASARVNDNFSYDARAAALLDAIDKV